jgi:dihydroxy-acid dehydratase
MRDGELVLNRYSSHLTNGYEFPGAQAMLYAAGIKTREDMTKKPHVGTSPLSPDPCCQKV